MAEGFPGSGEEALREFLEKMTLAAEENGSEESVAVRLMTLHNAKGLEFDVVFLVGLEDGLLPHSRSLESNAELEEERRLFYVGLTRAREKAFLSLARRRNLFGSFRDTIPSRFLYDLPSALVKWEGAPMAAPVAPPPRSGEIRYEREDAVRRRQTPQGAAPRLRGREGRIGRGGRGRPEDHRPFPRLRVEENPGPGRGDGVYRLTVRRTRDPSGPDEELELPFPLAAFRAGVGGGDRRLPPPEDGEQERRRSRGQHGDQHQVVFLHAVSLRAGIVSPPPIDLFYGIPPPRPSRNGIAAGLRLPEESWYS